MTTMTPERRSAIARGMLKSTIDATVLRELIQESYDEACAVHEASKPAAYVVSMKWALARLHDQSRIVKYHRADCRHLTLGEERLQGITEEVAHNRGYLPCVMCNEMSITRWSEDHGIDPSTVAAILRKDKTRIRKTNAIKILTAIGEEPHPSLYAYQQAA